MNYFKAGISSSLFIGSIFLQSFVASASQIKCYQTLEQRGLVDGVFSASVKEYLLFEFCRIGKMGSSGTEELSCRVKVDRAMKNLDPAFIQFLTELSVFNHEDPPVASPQDIRAGVINTIRFEPDKLFEFLFSDQLIPVSIGGVFSDQKSYHFEPKPFLEVFKKAYLNKNKEPDLKFAKKMALRLSAGLTSRPEEVLDLNPSGSRFVPIGQVKKRFLPELDGLFLYPVMVAPEGQFPRIVLNYIDSDWKVKGFQVLALSEVVSREIENADPDRKVVLTSKFFMVCNYKK